jgi:precorrin-3B synthase
MTAPAITVSQRRGACPGLSAPMQTGDGLLVRLMPTGTISMAAFAALCAAAREHGNGVIEITSRGSIQVRGLSDASAPQFAAAVAALDIAAEDGVPVLCNALAGLDVEEIFDSTSLAAELRRTIAQHALASKLSPKVSIVIDGGAVADLETVAADIRLRAQSVNGAMVLRISIGGDEARATELGYVTPAHAAEATLRLLDVIARAGRYARARDILAAQDVQIFCSAAAGLLVSVHPRESGDPALDSRFRGNERRTAIGMDPLRDGKIACGIGIAFGHADASSLERLAEAARAAGASGLRAAPGRTLLAIGLTPGTAATFVSAAEQLGFIVRADDPRRNVVACAGAPICASALIASRVLAPVIAATAAARLDGTIHISGCAKGCARASAAALTVVGTFDGCALIADGSTRDTPFAVVPVDELQSAITNYARGLNREAAHV